jgi:ABC-2 type transport system ATP-binding protein
MSEMAQTADHLLVIGRGRIITAAPIEEVIARATEEAVRVVTPRAAELSELLADRGADVVTVVQGELEVSGLSNVQVGELAAAHGLPLHELTPISASLEEAYLSLTRDQVEYRSEPMVEEASR